MEPEPLVWAFGSFPASVSWDNTGTLGFARRPVLRSRNVVRDLGAAGARLFPTLLDPGAGIYADDHGYIPPKGFVPPGPDARRAGAARLREHAHCSQRA